MHQTEERKDTHTPLTSGVLNTSLGTASQQEEALNSAESQPLLSGMQGKLDSTEPFGSDVNLLPLNGLRGLLSLHFMAFNTLQISDLRVKIGGTLDIPLFIIMSGFVLTYQQLVKIEKNINNNNNNGTNHTNNSNNNGSNTRLSVILDSINNNEVLIDEDDSYYSFLYRRGSRILPLYYLSNIIFIPLIYLGFGMFGCNNYATYISYFLTLFVANTWFVVSIGINTVAWFVSTILFFYFMFPWLFNETMTKLASIYNNNNNNNNNNTNNNDNTRINNYCRYLLTLNYIISIIIALMVIGIILLFLYYVFYIGDIISSFVDSDNDSNAFETYWKFLLRPASTQWPLSRVFVFLMGVIGAFLRFNNYNPNNNNDNSDNNNNNEDNEDNNSYESLIKRINSLFVSFVVILTIGSIFDTLYLDFRCSWVLELLLPMWQFEFIYLLTCVPSKYNNNSYLISFLTSDIMNEFGRISYSLYLLHPIVLYYVVVVYNVINGNNMDCSPNDKRFGIFPWYLVPIMWILAIMFAFIVNRQFEEPMKNYLRMKQRQLT